MALHHSSARTADHASDTAGAEHELQLGISPSGGRVVMTLAGTGVPTRGGRRR